MSARSFELLPEVVAKAKAMMVDGVVAASPEQQAPFKDKSRAESGLLEYTKVMGLSSGKPECAYLYRLSDIDVFPMIVNLCREALIETKKELQSSDDIRRLFEQKLQEQIAKIVDKDEIDIIQRINHFIMKCLEKIKVALSADQHIDDIFLQNRVESTFYNAQVFFSMELSRRELQEKGAVYKPNKHCWAGNYMWVLAHVLKGTPFNILCDFNEENCRSTHHPLKRKSAFAYEFCTLLKAGYTLRIGDGVTTRLEPSQTSQHIDLRENDGTEGKGINPTKEEIESVLKQIQAAKKHTPRGTFTITAVIQHGEIILTSPDVVINEAMSRAHASHKLVSHAAILRAQEDALPLPEKPARGAQLFTPERTRQMAEAPSTTAIAQTPSVQKKSTSSPTDKSSEDHSHGFDLWS